jgi:hypothetical protein
MTTTHRDLSQPLVLHDLTFLEDGDEVTVGRADIGSYGVFPPDGAALLRKLADGASPADAIRWYSAEYGEDVDIEEFLDVLDEFDLIVRSGQQRQGPVVVRWRRLGRAMFSPVAWVVYAALIATALVAMLRVPSVAPHYSAIFFTSSLVVVQVTLFFGQLPFILLHECFHALAGRRLGLNSTLRIGRRFYFLVFETSLDGLVTVPRRQRYLPILVGMVADLLSIAILTLIAVSTRDATGALSMAGRVCMAFAFSTVLRLVWQFYLFLRTDLYVLVSTVLGCHDLHATSLGLLRNRLNSLLGRTDRLTDESDWHPRDVVVGRWYSWLLVAGYVFLLASLVFAVIPSFGLIVGIIYRHLHGDPSVLGVLDSIVFLTVNLGQFVFVGMLARRSRRARRVAV